MNLRAAFTSLPIDQKGTEAIEKAGQLMDQVYKGLLAPLTEEERAPKAKEREQLPRIVFKGDIEEVNRFYYARHWTDGLPIMPPTEKAVKAMLKGTSHTPDEVLGIMPPESWQSTVEGVAINAVMAGCRPNHMPVLLATVEAFLAEPWYYNYVRSAGSYAFMQVINGPIVDEIGMNADINAAGPGNLANMAIGRALRMIIINQGGSLPGVNLMGALGNVAAKGFAIPENEKASPWEPFHVERGYGAKESVVTLFGGEGGFRSHDFNDATKTLRINKHRSYCVLLMGPIEAKVLIERNGLTTKSDVKKWLWENTKTTIEEWRDSVFYKNSLIPTLGKPGHHPAWYADTSLDPKTLVHVFPDPDAFYIVVTGGRLGAWETQFWEMGEPSSASVDKWR
ncbi:MAG: hypothetical protein JXA46_18165 [Dehalococcoidales bacterium]|nr:hypothetical protein [Dehalococcoidales bacterium]